MIGSIYLIWQPFIAVKLREQQYILGTTLGITQENTSNNKKADLNEGIGIFLTLSDQATHPASNKRPQKRGGGPTVSVNH